MLVELFVVLGCLFPTFLLWTAIHELSHLAAAKLTVGVKDFFIDVFPHKKQGSFYWSRLVYIPDREPSKKESIFIHLAPRIPDLVAIVLLPLVPLWFAGSPLVVASLSVFLLGGVIDGLVGSIGHGDHTDLKSACSGPFGLWTLRLSGWFIGLSSIAVWLVVLL